MGAAIAATSVLAWAWIGTKVPGPVMPAAGLLALWAGSGVLGAALTRHFGYAWLVVIVAVVAFSTVGNSIIAASNGETWTWSVAQPPYHLLRALAMNSLLGSVIGIPSIFATLWWLELRDD